MLGTHINKKAEQDDKQDKAKQKYYKRQPIAIVH
jgi:hypothetical protein